MTTTRKAKVRSWMKDHSFEIGVYTIFAAAVSGTLYLAIKQGEALVDQLQQQEEWENEQLLNGRTILVNENGRMVAVDHVVSIY